MTRLPRKISRLIKERSCIFNRSLTNSGLTATVTQSTTEQLHNQYHSFSHPSPTQCLLLEWRIALSMPPVLISNYTTTPIGKVSSVMVFPRHHYLSGSLNANRLSQTRTSKCDSSFRPVRPSLHATSAFEP
jgi:hypothetical protein